MTECQDCRQWLDAYHDNELATEAALKIHGHLLVCSDCRAAYQQLRQLTQLVRDKAPHYQAPAELAARINATLLVQGPQTSHGVGSVVQGWLAGWSWPRLMPAASFAALGLALFLTFGNPSAPRSLLDEAVSGHVRSLMATHLTDVVSSDRHTVKPWFIGKVDFAPPVTDFAPQGFTLIGGRLDYLQAQPAVALVYQHSKHVINLFILPVTAADAAPMALKLRGYNLLQWRKNAMQYVAVSDMDMDGLQSLGALLQEQVPN